MVAVGLGEEDVTRFLVDSVVVACENSPSSVTLSSDVELLEMPSSISNASYQTRLPDP
jgi:hypothetical protein